MSKFTDVIPLLGVQYVVCTDIHKTGRKFEIVGRNSKRNEKRHFLWRASTRDECEKWVNDIEQHRKTLLAKTLLLARNPDVSFNNEQQL